MSDREVEVAALVACGLTNRSIGQALGIAESTVAGHVRRALKKLAFHSRVELAAWFVEHRPGEREPNVKRPLVRTGIVLTAIVALIGLAGCGGGHRGSHGGSAGGGAKRCSDKHPSNLELTFAAIVCVTSETTVSQSDGSNELVLRVSITDKDPNAFSVTTTDFKVIDSAGHDISSEPASQVGRAGVSGCVSQNLGDSGWPLKPNGSMTLPGPMCFNLPAGDHAGQLVWQSDVAVKLS
jgi:DNA-binding CsgD family transcriptional regulator